MTASISSGLTKKPPETYGVANPRFIDEVGASQAGEITCAEHAISVDRAFGCRRIF